MNNNNLTSVLIWIIFIVIIVGVVIVATPQFTTVSKQLHTARAQHVAATLTSATAANYVEKKIASKGMTVSNCKDVTSIIGNNLPPGFLILDANLPSETITSCVLKGPGIEQGITFNVIGVK